MIDESIETLLLSEHEEDFELGRLLLERKNIPLTEDLIHYLNKMEKEPPLYFHTLSTPDPNDTDRMKRKLVRINLGGLFSSVVSSTSTVMYVRNPTKTVKIKYKNKEE